MKVSSCLFILLFMDYSFSSFWLQMRKDTMDISVQVFWWTNILISLLRNGTGSYNRCKQKLKRTAKEFSEVILDILHHFVLPVTLILAIRFCCSFVNISYSNG